MGVVKEKEFMCRMCGAFFLKIARKCYFCDACRKKNLSILSMRSQVRKNPNKVMGVGSGGNQRGEKNHRFKDGKSDYRGNYDAVHGERKACSDCGGTRNVVVHHKDRNRKNNEESNLIYLCRSCHAKLHEVINNIYK